MDAANCANPLTELATILYSGIETLLSEYNHQGVAFPLLSQPFTPSLLDTNSVVNESTCLIIAAAHQIIATVRAPAESIQEHATGAYTATALNLCVDLHVADILQGAGAQARYTHQRAWNKNQYCYRALV
ncbi:hypothetical protein HHX47_DHR7000319 [Lentinula edodes]|nr:hypothetical protein HHX47_DHR7000319 [Lentinula edodes]